ncbi:MAG: hypothetical protein ONB05_02440, partial [candidate division KSB1 bacterium]|nr:hypothetical protein [candidate division KSB1 bacterium]
GTSGILRHRFSVIQNTKIIFSITKPLFPTKYCRRWARRIRAFGFEREDADMLSLASFGTDKLSGGTFLGVHQIITPDKRFVKRFQENQHLINQHSRQWLGI